MAVSTGLRQTGETGGEAEGMTSEPGTDFSATIMADSMTEEGLGRVLI